jgi:hypothetical protein
MYDDTQEMDDRKLLAIARGPNELCEVLIFPSILSVESETMRENDKMAVCVRFNKDDGDLCGII